MRRLFLFMAILVFLPVISWAAAPTGGVITTTVRTNTTVLVQVTTAPTAVDSVFICRIKIGGTDTIYIAQIDSVTKAKVISSEPPGLNAAYFLRVNQGTKAAGKTAISDKDTVTVFGPEIEAMPATNANRLIEKVIRAVSWRPTTVTETFTVNGATGADSSGHYNAWKSNGIVVVATQAGDSVKTMLYTFYGHRDMTQTGETAGFVSSQDSLNISSIGTFGKTLTLNLATSVMYFKLQGYAGNGKNSAIEIYLTRDRY